MNVIVSNKYSEILKGLDIEVIKSMEGEFEASEIVDTFDNFYFDRMILDITSVRNYTSIENIQKISIGLDMNKVILILDDSPESESSIYISKLVSMGIYNFTRNIEGVKYLLEHPNSYRDVAYVQDLNTVNPNESLGVGSSAKIIGVKNLSDHAGATSLVYIMKKMIQPNYAVTAIEVNKRDFIYLNDPELVSTTSMNLPKELMKHRTSEIILIDLNDYDDDSICSDVIYLIEPGYLSLNRLIKKNRAVFDKYKNKKIVLNRSVLSNEDVVNFEYESKSKIFFNIPPIDVRNQNIPSINKFLVKLGILRGTGSGDSNDDPDKDMKNKLMGMFKF